MIRLTVKFEMADFRRWCDGKAEGLKAWGTGPIQGARAMIDALEQYHAGLFASGGAGQDRASGYGPWIALKFRTLKARAYRTRCSRIQPFDYTGAPRSDRTLSWSWRLRDSLAGKGNTFGDAIRKMGPRGVDFGTSTPTALFHAAGRGGRNPMPVRMPLDDIIGPEVAIDAAEDRIMAFLFADGNGAPSSPGMVRNAAGFYARA